MSFFSNIADIAKTLKNHINSLIFDDLGRSWARSGRSWASFFRLWGSYWGLLAALAGWIRHPDVLAGLAGWLGWLAEAPRIQGPPSGEGD